MRTSSPRRWIWIRIPSSFHSTDERAKLAIPSPTPPAVEASIGRIGLKSSKPTARSPSSPSVSAVSAVRVRSPESMNARRASSAGTPAAFATASTISPASAPCRSSPVKSRLTKSASSSVARARRFAEDPPSGRGRAAPSRRLHLRDRAIDLVDREGRLQGGRLFEAVDRRVADPDPPLPGHAGEEADRDRNLVRVEPPQELGEELDLARARARTGYLSRGGDDVGEQGHRRARRVATARTAASTSAPELTIPGPSRT